MKVAETKKLIKQLIKKHHPDLCQDENSERINNEITRKLTGILNDLKIQLKTPKENNDNTVQPENTLVPKENQDYLYYNWASSIIKTFTPTLSTSENPIHRLN